MSPHLWPIVADRQPDSIRFASRRSGCISIDVHHHGSIPLRFSPHNRPSYSQNRKRLWQNTCSSNYLQLDRQQCRRMVFAGNFKRIHSTLSRKEKTFLRNNSFGWKEVMYLFSNRFLSLYGVSFQFTQDNTLFLRIQNLVYLVLINNITVRLRPEGAGHVIKDNIYRIRIIFNKIVSLIECLLLQMNLIFPFPIDRAIFSTLY